MKQFLCGIFLFLLQITFVGEFAFAQTEFEPEQMLYRSKFEHAQDIVEAFHGNPSAQQPLLRELAGSVSSTIDNFKVISELNTLYGENGLQKISQGQHRVYGHWGYSGSIPKGAFEAFYESIDKSALSESQKEALRKQVKKIITEHWVKDVTSIRNQVAALFPGLTERQVRGIAGMMYDLHVLGDMTTSAGVNPNIIGGAKALQNINALARDIEKNIFRILGSRSKVAQEMIEQLRPLFKELENATTASQKAEVAKKINQELAKNQKLREQLAKGQESGTKGASASAKAHTNVSQYKMNWNQAITMGVSMAIFRNAGSIINTFAGDEEWQNTLAAVGCDAAGYTVSIKVANALIVEVGGKIALLSWLPKASNSMGGAVIAGMFIFDSSKVGFSYLQGNIAEEEFIEEFISNSKQTMKAAIAASVAFAIVPGGQPVVVGILLTTGVMIVADRGIDQLLSNVNYGDLTIEEMESFFQVSFDGYFTSFSLPKNTNLWGDDVKHDLWGEKKYPTSFDLPKHETIFP